jgi:hypothetical protein
MFNPPSFYFISLPLLKMISTSFIVLFSHKYIKHIDHAYLPSPLHSPSSLPLVPTLNRSCFIFLIFIFEVYIYCPKGFCHGISLINILYINQSNPPLLIFVLFPRPYYSTSFIMPSSYTG